MSKGRKEYDAKYDAKRAGQRTRNWAVIFWVDDLPEKWQAKIDDQLMCKWIEGPVHDRDVWTEEDELKNEDHKAGTPKKKHVHALFMFDSVKCKEQVVGLFKSVFGESETKSIVGVSTPQLASDRSAVVRYMAHMDHPKKAQYSKSDIIGHNGADPTEVLQYSVSETQAMMIEIEEFIDREGITELTVLSRAIRYDKPDWYLLVTTKATRWFEGYVRSNRHAPMFPTKAPKPVIPEGVDPETGEVLDNE